MKKHLAVWIAVLGLVVIGQEYDPEPPMVKATITETETTTGFRLVVESSVPQGRPSSNVVTTIRSCRLVTWKKYENGVVVEQRNNQVRDEVNTLPWFMARTNISGDILPIHIKPEAAIQMWKAWRTNQPIPSIP